MRKNWESLGKTEKVEEKLESWGKTEKVEGKVRAGLALGQKSLGGQTKFIDFLLNWMSLRK